MTDDQIAALAHTFFTHLITNPDIRTEFLLCKNAQDETRMLKLFNDTLGCNPPLGPGDFELFLNDLDALGEKANLGIPDLFTQGFIGTHFRGGDGGP